MPVHVRIPRSFRTSRSTSRYIVAAIGLAAIVLWAGGDNARTWEHASRDSARVPRGWQTTDPGWGITAHHPPTWGNYAYQTVYLGGVATVGYLSTERLHKPCVHLSGPGRAEHVEGTCAPLLRHLAGDGILIQWNLQKQPGRDPLNTHPGTPTVLAGRAARLRTIAAPKSCSSIGGTELMTAAIGTSADPGDDERWYVTACLGHAHSAVNEADVLTMLKTATLPSL